MRLLRQSVVTIAVLALTTNVLLSQTGPGGVGNSTDNKLWLDAADASTKTLNGPNVSQWSDKSGNGNHATQATVARQPANNLTGINSRATITFDGLATTNGDKLALPSVSVLTSNTPFSFFALFKPSDLTGYHQIYAGGNNGAYTAFETDGTKIEFYDAANGAVTVTGPTTLSGGTAYIFDAYYGPSVSLNLNGTNESTGSLLVNAAIPENPRTVGGSANNDLYNWNGDIGEIIIYNRNLNAAERKIVGSYLAAKWIVVFAGGPYGGSSNYYENVIGIGQESDGSNTSAKVDGLVLTSNSSINANGEYLMAGHNVGANSIVTSDVTASVTHRWSRIWYLDKTGTLDGGNVQIGFDFSDGGLGGTPATAANYRLLYRSGTSGNFGEVTTATSNIVGDNVNFTVTDANLVTGYYTVGTTNNSSSPLPVEMSNVSATSRGSSATVNWSTATETNSYGFDIERRSVQEQAWVKVGSVISSGTSSSPNEYSFIDREATAGWYSYRIKQIDKDGSFKYTGEVEVEVGVAPKEFNLVQNYPNPFNPSTTIEFTLPADSRAILKVVDMLGRNVATVFDGEAKAGYYNRVVFDASHFASGTYFARLEAGGKQILKKMVLMK